MEQTPRELFKALKIMHAALTAGVAIMIIVIVTLNQFEENEITDKTTIQYIWTISMIFTLSTIPAAYYLFKKKLSVISEDQTLIQKLMVYRSSFIIKMAMLEACSFINIVFYMLTKNMYVLYAAIIVLIIILLNFPKKSTISNDLNLNYGESEQL